MKKTPRILLVIAVSWIPIAYFLGLYSHNAYHDPYMVDNVVMSLAYYGNIATFENPTVTYTPGYAVLIFILDSMLNVDVTSILYRPILILPFIPLIYILSRNFVLRSEYAILTIPIVYFLFFSSYYSVWVHGFGFVLFLVIMFGVYKLLSGTAPIKYLVVMIFSITAISLYSYRASTWVILTTGILILMLALSNNRTLYNRLLFAFSFSVVEYFSINRIFYEHLKDVNIINLIISFYVFYLYKVPTNKSPIYDRYSPYLYRPPSHGYTRIINLIVLGSLVFPVFIGIIKFVFNKFSNDNHNKKAITIFAISLISPLIVDVIIYGMLGRIFLTYILFIFPILATYFFIILYRRPRETCLFLMLLFSLSLILTTFNWEIGTSIGGPKVTSTVKFQDTWPSAQWFLHHYEKQYPLVTDHYTGAQYSLFGVTILKLPFLRDRDYLLYSYNPEIYVCLVNPTLQCQFQPKMYIVVSTVIWTQKTWGDGWIDFKPLFDYRHRVLSNPYLNEVYTDDNVIILISR